MVMISSLLGAFFGQILLHLPTRIEFGIPGFKIFLFEMGRKKIQKAPKTPKAQEEEDHVSDAEKSPEPEVKAPKGKRGAQSAKK